MKSENTNDSKILEEKFNNFCSNKRCSDCVYFNIKNCKEQFFTDVMQRSNIDICQN